MHRKENIEELKQQMKKANTLENAFAIIYQMLQNEDSTEELCAVLQEMKLTDEMKEEMEEEELVKK